MRIADPFDDECLLFSPDYIYCCLRERCKADMEKHEFGRLAANFRLMHKHSVQHPNNKTVRINMSHTIARELTHASKIIQMLCKHIKRALALAEHTAKCERNMWKNKKNKGKLRALSVAYVERTEHRTLRARCTREFAAASRVQMALILIKLFNLEPFNSSLWICTGIAIRTFELC